MDTQINSRKTDFTIAIVSSAFIILSILLSACQPITVNASSGSNPTPTQPENTFSPFMTVLDQVIVNNSVIIEEVYSNGPGWVVIFADNSGRPGVMLGHTAVKDGDNQNLIVTIDPSKVTTVMYSLLLRDQGIAGVFEFPGPDNVVVSNDALILKPFDILKSITSSDPALQILDQSISGGRIILSSVTSQGPGWAVIYAQKNGKPGSIIGRTAVNDGTNNDVIVEINSSKASSTLYAELFSDQGKIGVFENPGPDNPEVVAGQAVNAVFKVLKSGAGSNLVISIKKDSKLGIYLVDGKGMTLYQQKKDRPFQMSCYPGCLEAWPPVTTSAFPQTSGGVNSSRLGILTLPNGARVVTYNSLPLYYYKLDTQAGDLKGQGIASVWHVVVP
jgi:predicted lipoprotein with Yx(FWY)xxD motif